MISRDSSASFVLMSGISKRWSSEAPAGKFGEFILAPDFKGKLTADTRDIKRDGREKVDAGPGDGSCGGRRRCAGNRGCLVEVHGARGVGHAGEAGRRRARRAHFYKYYIFDVNGVRSDQSDVRGRTAGVVSGSRRGLEPRLAAQGAGGLRGGGRLLQGGAGVRRAPLLDAVRVELVPALAAHNRALAACVHANFTLHNSRFEKSSTYLGRGKWGRSIRTRRNRCRTYQRRPATSTRRPSSSCRCVIAVCTVHNTLT